MPYNVYSAAGKLRAYDIASPGYMPIWDGLEYVIVFENPTDTAIEGSFTIEDAGPSADDDCVPSEDWAPVVVEPQCDDAPDAVAGPATVVFSTAAGTAVQPHSQCHVAVPCVRDFVRVATVSGGTGLNIIGVMTRLKSNSFTYGG